MKINLKTIPALLFIFGAISLTSCGSDKSAEGENKSTTDAPMEKAAKETAIPEDAMFKIKSAKISYEISNSNENGTAELLFDDYGSVAVYDIHTKGAMGEINQTQTWKDKGGLVINHLKKNATKSFFRSKDSEAPSLATTPDDTKKNIGYTRLPDEVIAGKTCEVWKNEKLNFQYWLWNNIEMKVVLDKSITRTATSVEEGISIPAEKFEVPSGYKGPGK